MYSMEGNGTESSGDFLFFGYSRGGNGNGINRGTTYDVHAGSVGVGLPLGYVNWMTDTSVYGKR